MINKRFLISLVLLATAGGLGVCAHAEVADTNGVLQVRSAIAAVVNVLPSRRCGTCTYLKEFGFRKREFAEYRNLATAVSNNYAIVFSNFGSCATNDLERMVLLSAGWAYDDDYYMKWYSNLLDAAEAGVVSRAEVKWFNEGSGNERRMNLLAIKYDEPGVSNIVYKLQNVTGDTNLCRRILSGESKNLYLQYFAEMSCGSSSDTGDEQ